MAAAGPAAASGYKDSVGVTKADAKVKAALRAVRAAEARLSEARAVARATRTYSAQYGTSVGRWMWLASDVGWPRSTFGQLAYVIYRESRGSPKALNPTSSAAGLLQFMPQWYTGQWGYPAFDPFEPRTNLTAGVWLWKRQGWSPWSVH